MSAEDCCDLYHEFYKLRGLPFRITPDAQFYYGSKMHSRAMSYIEVGLEYGEGFISITGDVGSGKTMLIDRVMATYRNDSLVVAKLETMRISGERLTLMVARALGLEIEVATDRTTAWLAVTQYLSDLHRRRQRCVLFVDEAHFLEPDALDELRMLSDFSIGGRSLLQTFLLAQPAFTTLIRAPRFEPLRQRILAHHHLSALDRQETEQYVRHRLSTVGWSGDPEFTPSAFEAIHAATLGVPRTINSLCNRLMLFGYLSDLHRLDARDVLIVLRDMQRDQPVTLPPRRPH